MKRRPSECEKIFANKATKDQFPKDTDSLWSYISKIQTIKTKMGRRPKQTFLQRRHIDGQQTHEKMLNITNYQRNANQNYSEGGGPKMAEEQDGETTFSPTNSSKEHLNIEQTPQNNF